MRSMPHDLCLLRRCLGTHDGSKPRAKAHWGDRNAILIREGTTEAESMGRLVADGFAIQTSEAYYRATLKGAKWMGIPEKKLMELFSHEEFLRHAQETGRTP